MLLSQHNIFCKLGYFLVTSSSLFILVKNNNKNRDFKTLFKRRISLLHLINLLEIRKHLQILLYEKLGSIPLSRAIMREGLRWLGHFLRMKDDIFLRMKDDRLPKIILFDQPFRVKQKAGRPQFGWDDVRKYLSEIGTSWRV